MDKWERTLSLILEVVEMILTVQRQWMYLEVGPSTSPLKERPHQLTNLTITTVMSFSQILNAGPERGSVQLTSFICLVL